MTTAAIPRPEPSEYVPYYETYLSKVPKGDLLTLLEDQRRETQQLLSGLSEAKALHRYAPGKWSIKEVVGHLMDTERVFCYRALAFARADANPLDRKSTRLNSSHQIISYAVFCLKKKKKNIIA